METTTGKTMTVRFEKEISFDDILGLLESAEQGTAYWAELGEEYDWKNALKPGGHVLIEDMEDGMKQHHLTIEKVQKGFEVMMRDYPTHYADFAAENWDMNTADVFLQCALFGETLYG